jgi:hypothetical protein
MHTDDPQNWRIRRRIGLSLLAGALGAGMCVAVGSHDPQIFWRASLLGVISIWLVPMGAAGLLAIGNLTGGRWAEVARPFYLATMGTLPFVAVLFVPLAFGLERIYPWATSGGAEGLTAGKAIWLSPAFVLVRSAAYFIIWLVVTRWLGNHSRLDLPPGSTLEMRRAGAVSLLILVPTTTFAAFDWVMSLDPHWYSSIFGAILTAAGVVAAHAIAVFGVARSSHLIPALLVTAEGEAYDERTATNVLADLGNLLLAFTMVWTYFTLSQFIIIWSANLPSEISWYIRRLDGDWQYVGIAAVLVAFAAPFFILLSRDVKRNVWRLAIVAVVSLAGYGIYMAWIILPSLYPADGTGISASIAVLVAVAGFWSALNSWQLGRIVHTHFEK